MKTLIILSTLIFALSIDARVRKESNTLKLSDIVSEEKNILIDCKSNKVSTDKVKDKYVGVYFSASWCGPCKAFNPKLKRFYDKNKNEFEIIFISLDRDTSLPPGNADKFHLQLKTNYIKSSKMNWLTTNTNYYANAKLHTKTGNRGIPRLVVFSPTGKYITNHGYYDVRNDEDVLQTTWKQTK